MVEEWWLSTERMTVWVKVYRTTIVDTSPIVKKFRKQPFGNILAWMSKQPGFKAKRLKPWCDDRKEGG